MTQHKQTGKM